MMLAGLIVAALIVVMWGIPALLWESRRQTLVNCMVINLGLLAPFVVIGFAFNREPEQLGVQMLCLIGVPLFLLYWLVALLVIAVRQAREN